MGPFQPARRPMLVIHASLAYGLAAVAVAASTGQQRLTRRSSSTSSGAGVDPSLATMSGDLRGLIQRHGATLSVVVLGKESPGKGGAAAPDEAAPDEPWALPLAPSEIDQTREVEPEPEEKVNEDGITSRKSELPKFVGSTPTPAAPPLEYPPYGTFTNPTNASDPAVTMKPLNMKAQLDSNQTEARRAHARLNCILAEWGPWSDCEQEAQGLPGMVQRRKREVLNSQHVGGLPCNATISTRRCTLAQ
mmetsp:Transcript_132222/g.257641  ORF Transcript_132222/g.257641 Transcript_132222/m.257641 type:complete len:248 (+) Transcript_132222:95-838(+)